MAQIFKFETKNIEIIDEKNEIIAGKGKVISLDDDLEINADKFKYFKDLDILKANGNGLAIIRSKNIKFEFDNAIFDQKNLIIEANQNVNIDFTDKGLNIKKDKIKDNFKLVYMSTINTETSLDEKNFWEKSKKDILSDFSTIDKIDFWKYHFPNTEAKIINQYYRKVKLLLRYEIILHLKEKFKEKFILIGSDWSKFSIESRESNYSIKQNKELYRGNICLDLGCIEGSSSLYSRSNQIIESGGLIIQTNQLDYKNKWNQLSEKILFKNFISLDFILEKIFNNYEYANTLLNQIHENFSNTEKLMENSLDEVISYK